LYRDTGKMVDSSCWSRDSKFERSIYASICSLLALWNDLVGKY
jgi:hypothetical protein